jgi:hypothetical protein
MTNKTTTSFFTMPVSEHLKPLQNEARRWAIRDRNAGKRFAALGGAFTNSDLTKLEAVEALYEAAYKAFLDAYNTDKAKRDDDLDFAAGRVAAYAKAL